MSYPSPVSGWGLSDIVTFRMSQLCWMLVVVASASSSWAQPSNDHPSDDGSIPPFERAAIELPSVAGATEEERETLATELEREGRSHLAAGRSLEATRYLEASVRFDPEIEIIVLLSETYASLGRHSAAMYWLERARDLQPTATEGALRDRIEVDLTALRSRVAALTITCRQEGLNVFIEGRYQGTTPLGSPIVIDPGSYSIEGRRSGFEPDRRRVELVAGSSREVELEAVDAVRNRRRSALDLSLWSIGSIGAVGAFCLAFTGTNAIIVRQRYFELDFPTEEAKDTLDRWQLSSLGLAITAGTAVTAAVALAVVRALRHRRLSRAVDEEADR